MQYKRISADCHLDMPWMPPELFTSEASREMRDRMPYVADGPDGPEWVTKSGATFGLKNGVGPSGAKLVPGQNRRVDIMAETGLFADGKKDIRRVSDPHLRKKDMERDGVDAEVIFGILGSASKLKDNEAAAEMFRIYNDWLKEFCSHYPDRHIGLACLPYGDIDWAVQEIHRCAKMGLKGLELSCSWDMEPMWHPCWEPLWQAVSDVQLPLHFHTFPTTPPRAREMASGQVRGGDVHRRVGVPDGADPYPRGDDGRWCVRTLPAPARVVRRERHRLDTVCAGSDGLRVRGPVPRSDEAEAIGILAASVQGDVPVRSDRTEAAQREQSDDGGYADVGVRLPAHGRDLARASTKYIEEQFQGLSAEDIHKITCENAAKFYNLTN